MLEKLFPKLDNRTQSGSLLVNKKSTNQENLLQTDEIPADKTVKIPTDEADKIPADKQMTF